MRSRTVPLLGGLLTAAYGGLILLRILAHESPLVGVLLLWAGAALIAFAGIGDVAPARTPGRWAFSVLGGILSSSVLLYNVAARSTWSVPEVALAVYGLILVVGGLWARERVGPVPVARALAWSLPLLGAPLAMWAVDAFLSAQGRGSPLDPVIRLAVVDPAALALGALGFHVVPWGKTLLLATPRGALALSIGLVCAGIQPGIVFLSLVGMHSFETRAQPSRTAVLLALALGGVYVANLLRVVLLCLVGYQWGGTALEAAHANAGWILIVMWGLLYWTLVARLPESAPRGT